MSRFIPTALLSLVPLALATQATADPVPGYANRGFVAGANHHIGDAGFEAAFGREPTAGEEHARVHEHFVYVEKMLASRPATKPELAAKRAAMLAFFDDYIRRDITPQNRNLPWRAPVFIDDKGTICAVGYLIEKSAGRALAEKVAATHKFDYIDDIAAKMPEVKAWAEASGLSLEELASIQPGYVGPMIEQYRVWASQDPEHEGAYDNKRLGYQVLGQFQATKMEGDWRVVDTEKPDVVVGKGTLHHGTGVWTSFFDDGKVMATGQYKRNIPTGQWKLYHPSGNLAGEGKLRDGLRDGRWTFYYDTADKTPIAIGQFSGGALYGKWRHFDAHGKLVARSDGQIVTVVPGVDHVEHEILSYGGSHVDRFALGLDQLFVVDDHDDNKIIYDADGHQIQKVDGRWAQSQCELSKKTLAAARATDLTTFASLIRRRNEPVCDEYHPVAAARAARIDKMIAPMMIVRAQSPEFVRALVLGKKGLSGDAVAADAGTATAVAGSATAGAAPDAIDVVIAAANGISLPAAVVASADVTPPTGADLSVEDLVQVVAASLVGDVEWPYTEKPFMALYASLPGLSNNYL